MFTGIIEEIGQILRIERRGQFQRLVVKAEKVLKGTKIGDSINIDGACQTVVEIDGQSFTIESVGETLRRTTLGKLKAGDLVNLERSLRPSDRLSGHLVTGHVDGIGTIMRRQQESNTMTLTIRAPGNLRKYIAQKGSIAVDGISLTVVSVTDDTFTVSIIPYTLENTTIFSKKVGHNVNLEVDILAKYTERLLDRQNNRKITESWLKQLGF